MATVHDSYLGVAEEVTYGTAVAPARFFEMPAEGIAGKYERIESEAFRAGQRVLHKGRFVPNPKGAEGDFELEVQDGAFGLLLKHALGAVASGTPTGGFTDHTITVGALKGKSLTVQVGRVDLAGTVQPFTYEGGKIKSWELSSAVDGLLKMKLDWDFEKETIGAGAGAYAAATPTYHATSQLLTFLGATVTIAGTAFPVNDIMFKGDNGLKTDRWPGGVKREPLEEGLRKYEFELKAEFEDLTQINRVASATAAGALAAIVATWVSPAGGQLVVTLPFARFDEGPANFSGAELIEQSLKGIGTWDGTATPITVLYHSVDATV